MRGNGAAWQPSRKSERDLFADDAQQSFRPNTRLHEHVAACHTRPASAAVPAATPLLAPPTLFYPVTTLKLSYTSKARRASLHHS